MSNKTKKANKPTLVSLEFAKEDPRRKVDIVILPIPFSITCQNDLRDFSNRTGIGTCVDYLSKRFAHSTEAENVYRIVDNIPNLIKRIDKGETKVSRVVCAQCHGLPQKMQDLLMCGVVELHKRGISVVFVKDGIEFRGDEETTSFLKRSLQYIGRYSDFISFISKKDKNTSGDNGEDA